MTQEKIQVEEQKKAVPKTIGETQIKPGLFLFPSWEEHEMREMTVAEENKLVDDTTKNRAEVLNVILKECFTSPVDVTQMLIGDRIFAIIQLRRLTHGDLYEFKCQCPGCKERFIWEENLAMLKVQYLKDKLHADPGNLFSFEFPKTKHRIKWRLLRGVDEEFMTQVRKNHPKEVMSYSMYRRTKEIEGKDFFDASFFATLPGSDSATFRGEIEENDCGVDTTLLVECPNPTCQNQFEMELPLDFDFFIPTKRKRPKI